MSIKTEDNLVPLCLQLIGSDRAAFSLQESGLICSLKEVPSFSAEVIEDIKSRILNGEDPLGTWLSSIRPTAIRRKSGAIYTPSCIVTSMVGWVAEQGAPDRIVDAGAGSGRFIVEAGDRFPSAELVAIEVDPVASLILRANLTVKGHIGRARIIVDDFRNVELHEISGMTAFIGNPPYVRHHEIDSFWKKWYAESHRRLGIKASALAGLHLHFLLKTRLLSKPGDVGTFITSSEWMDVNYGSSLRKLFLDELGGLALHVLEPSVEAFPGTCTTAAITCFKVGEKPESVKVRSVEAVAEMNRLSHGLDVPRLTLERTPKWSKVVRPTNKEGAGEIELGELFRVHRGQVTGANKVWVADAGAPLPERVLYPAVTKAKELFAAGDTLHDAAPLKRVIDIPADYGSFSDGEIAAIENFLCWARAQGASETYIAAHRKAWWSVGLKPPAPILCTYMARRPPQFTLNLCAARHINIAHGLYPVTDISPEILARIVSWLNNNVCQSSGRTYSGGLTKFEPKEIERIKIPSIERLTNG